MAATLTSTAELNDIIWQMAIGVYPRAKKLRRLFGNPASAASTNRLRHDRPNA
jgi:hypothetical protein